MSEPTPRIMEIFFEVFEGLPRQGPGNRASTARALALCGHLPPEPEILDLGCGAGAQTLHLAELCAGTIVAVDSHGPSIERLRRTVGERGLAGRITPIAGDFADLRRSPERFDLVWSEGALYNLGLESALPLCRELLRPGGYLAFTDAVWRRTDPPREVRAMFEDDYPTMGRVPEVLTLIEREGLILVDHFTLPDAAWWDDFYTPMRTRIEELRRGYAGDEEALAALAEVAREPELHERYSEYYAYEFFVARRGAS